MATTTVTEMVTKTLSGTAGTAGTATGSSRAVPQGGVLENGNPAAFDPKNPIALFIVQVRIWQPHHRDGLD